MSFQQAVRIYIRECERNGFVPMQPSNASDRLRKGKGWLLHNCRGDLAIVKDNGQVIFK